MKFRHVAYIATGVIAGYVFAGEGGPGRPADVMGVDCVGNPGDAEMLNLKEVVGRTGLSNLIIDVMDGKERTSVTVRTGEGLLVNEQAASASDAGREVTKVGSAILYLGVLAPEADVFRDADKGLTLVCQGATYEQIRTNG